MATINISKGGYSVATNYPTHAGARGALAGNPSFTAANPTSNIDYSVSYITSISRRSSTYSIGRSFFYFKTNTITSTPSAASLNITGYSTTAADVIVVPSSAFGGNGGTAFDKYDYSELTFSPYSAEYTSWGTSNNSISLNAAALTALGNQSNPYFIIALIQYDNDYLDVSSAPASVTRNSGIAWGTTPYLDYTVGGGGPNLKTNGVQPSGISKWDGTSWSSISKINNIS